MEVIELHHEVCYRSLDELLEDLCPRSSLLALSSITIKSKIPPHNSALAILSKESLILVQDIQNAIDYISADNLIVIELHDIQEAGYDEGWLALKLKDKPGIVLEESNLDSELRQIGGFATSFSTLCVATELLVGFKNSESSSVIESESNPVAILSPFKPPTPSANNQIFQTAEKSVEKHKSGWILAIVLFVVFAAICFFVWINWNKPTQESSTVSETVTTSITDSQSVNSETELVSNSKAIEENVNSEQSTKAAPIVSPAKSNVLKASSYKETIYGEVWPNDWVSSADAKKDIQVSVTSKGSLYQVEYLVNGDQKQTLFVVPNQTRSKQLTATLSGGNIHSYSNPSSGDAVHVDVINATLDDLLEARAFQAIETIQMQLSVESADYAVAFKF